MASLRNNPRAEEWKKTGNHSVINYSATVSTQSYMRQTETILGYRLPSVATDDNPLRLSGPGRVRLIEGYGSPKKDDEFSQEERLKGSPWNSAAYKNHSPFSGEDDHDVSTDDDSDDEITCVNGVCYRGNKGPNKDGNYNWNGEYGGHNWPKPVHGKQEYNSDHAMESPKATGGKPYFQQHNSPVSMSPKKGAYHENPNRPIWPSSPRGKPDTDRPQSPKPSRKPIFTPVCTSPNKDAYREKPDNKLIGPNSHWSKPDTNSDDDEESSKPIRKPSCAPANGNHPYYSAPANNNLNAQSPQIRNKPEYDTSYASESPKARRNPQHTFPANNSYYVTPYEEKPALDNGKGMEVFPNKNAISENPKPKYPQQPQYREPARTHPNREGHQPTIDSQEASKRYGNKGVVKPTPEETYAGTIDCKEAARKYNGVLVP